MKRSSFEQERRRVYVNEKQRQFLAARQKRRSFVGGRGSGKTTVAGHETRVQMNYLPRAKGFLAGLTYTQLLSNTLPAMEGAWQAHGLREYDLKSGFGHYVKGKRPPAEWIKPYQPPSNYENVISFLNGYTIQLLSMDRAELARGGNYDFGHIDESALMKEEHVNKILRPMIRGNIYRFKDEHHQTFCDYTSVPWLPSGQWVFKTEDLAQEDPENHFFLESTAYDNVHVLGEKYLRDLRNGMTPLEWDVEVMNKRLTKLPNSFYPSFSEEKHGVWKTYTYVHDDETGLTLSIDSDRDPKRLLELSFDFNAAFTSLIVCQEHGNEFRALDALWVKQSSTTVLDALVDKFCDTYESHERKELLLYGDRNGNNKQVGSNLTLYQTIQQGLAARGWKSTLMVQGLDPDHRLKHIAINQLLAENNPRLPVMRFNRNKCKFLIISIQQSPINPDWTKNKNSEKSSIDQERATHLSDCFDNIVYRKYGHLFGQAQRFEPVYFLGRE
ncbi:terminase large subunit domain-containing protein [Hymenobacter convexus]|uniref:terminase large subunit domain-containing protein n=1 Tax=Hymenobacter sp. CA1UV-4 TaxID=3063782 RepID=UPI0027124B66|nr:terminase family protein [Hymenobacter sp. CA1UV-4]MDO7851557.1 terminase family protein [Hymenobacter sp. CA1UV-4]